MKYALLLMGHTDDPACGEDGGASPEEFFAFDKEITDAGVVVSSFALEDPEHGTIVRSDESGERIVSSASMAVYKACSHALGSYTDSARPWMRGIVQAPAVRVSASTAAAEAQRRICVKTR